MSFDLTANAKLKADKEIFLHADQELPYGFVVKVMAAAKAGGAENLGMVTDPITAAVPKIPKPLLGQLATGGFLVVPVGYGGAQELIVCEKRPDKLIERVICNVRFVKLFGEHGFEQ